MTLPRAAAFACALSLAIGGTDALAHGPCNCLVPARGEAGTELTITYPAVRVVWNPARRHLLIGPDHLYARIRRGQPSIELFRSERRRRRVRVTVPDAAPGRYLVATYDGGEGGAHYTWDDFELVARKRPRRESREAYDVLFWLSIAGGVVLLADVLIQLRRPRRPPS